MASLSSSTIFACSSGAGRAGIAVWRVSGAQAGQVIDQLTKGRRPKPRYAAHRVIYDLDGDQIDDGLILWLPGPNTVTGEDVAEFHLHGSIAVGDKFASVLTALGLEPAASGAFTMRAFAHGQMDLLGVEGLGDLLDAETESQRKQALNSHVARDKTMVWREGFVKSLASLEAAVDFPDEEDVPDTIANQALPIIKDLYKDIKASLAETRQGQKIREGVSLAIIGPPNVGKSSLLNRLLGEDRAIVSDRPGTTRDIVSARFNIAGRVVNILDTAGLRKESQDKIEKEGMARSLQTAKEADIILLVEDEYSHLKSFEKELENLNFIRVKNKIDMQGPSDKVDINVSAQTGEGVRALLSRLEKEIISTASPSLFPRERQARLLELCEQRLRYILDNPAQEAELLSEDIRLCVTALDQLVGRISTEDVLGSIFSSFCIGK